VGDIYTKYHDRAVENCESAALKVSCHSLFACSLSISRMQEHSYVEETSSGALEA